MVSSKKTMVSKKEAKLSFVNPKYTNFEAWSMWGLVTFFFAFMLVVRVTPNVMMQELLQKFSIEATDFGQFAGIYYIGYVLLHIPVGLLLDRVGPRRVIPVCAAVVSLGIVPLIISTNFMEPTIGRFVIGLGSSAATLGCFKIISMVFRQNHFNLMVGISVSAGFMAAMFGGTPTLKLIGIFGIDKFLTFLVCLGLFISVLSYFVIHDLDHEQKVHESGIFDDLKRVMLNYRVLFIALIGGLMVGPVEGFADGWGKSFLATVHGVPFDSAAFLSSLILMGFAFGAPLVSFIADKTHAFFAILAICAVFMIIGFAAILLSPHLSYSTFLILFPLIGVASSYQIVIIYLASISVPHRMVGVATAWANMLMMAFGYVYHSGIGALMDMFWTGEIDENGIRIYPVEGFIKSLSIIPFGLTLAVVFLIILKLGIIRANKKSPLEDSSKTA